MRLAPGGIRREDGYGMAPTVSSEFASTVDTNRGHARKGSRVSVARSLTMWLALGVASGGAWFGWTRPVDSGALCTITAILVLARTVHIASNRDRPLAFTTPIIFATLLWFGTGVAVWSALAAHLWPGRARLGGIRTSREAKWFQGGQLSIAAMCAGSVLDRLTPVGHWYIAPAASGSRFGFGRAAGYLFSSDRAYTATMILWRQAGLAAIAFLLVILLLETLISVCARQKREASMLRNQMGLCIPVYAAVLIPLVALAPLAAMIGLAAVLPATLLAILMVYVVRLRTDVARLRSQLTVAGSMGRAGIADSESVEPSELLEHFLLLAKQLVKSDRSAVWVLDAEKGELHIAATTPHLGSTVKKVAQYGDGLIGHAATRIRPWVIADAARDSHRGQQEAASGSWLLYPIIVRNQVLAVAQWARSAARPFCADDIARLDSLVNQATIALENIQIRARLRDLASTDGLTGLWNQQTIGDILRDELCRSQRYQRVLSVLMLDLDSFKTYNDTYGHQHGDHLLRSIASTLRSTVRAIDQVGRFGGDEFLIVLPETSKDDAFLLAERLRSDVQERGFVLSDGTAVAPTISIGVASYPEDALNSTELVQRADQALYRAKRSGKNCVIWA